MVAVDQKDFTRGQVPYLVHRSVPELFYHFMRLVEPAICKLPVPNCPTRSHKYLITWIQYSCSSLFVIIADLSASFLLGKGSC